MSAATRLWARAPAWRGILLLGVVLSGLAAIYAPSRPFGPATLPGAHYVTPAPVAVPARPAPPPVTAPVTDPNLPQFGTVVSGTVRFAGTVLPLPHGDWAVVAAMAGRDQQGRVAVTSMLAQVAGGALDAAIVLSAVMPSVTAHGGFPAGTSCQSPYALFNRVFSAVDHGPQSCWIVEALTLQDWNAAGMSPVVRSGVAEMRQRSTSLPPVVLRAYFHYADADHLLTMDVLKAVPSPPQPPFGWLAAEVLRTPGKRVRATRLRDWAVTWDALVRRSFDGKLLPDDITSALSALPD